MGISPLLWMQHWGAVPFSESYHNRENLKFFGPFVISLDFSDRPGDRRDPPKILGDLGYFIISTSGNSLVSQGQ
ncbi:MAG: hypothetical protein AAFY11_02890 [Cyanobacteria bacterium J06641_5]